MVYPKSDPVRAMVESRIEEIRSWSEQRMTLAEMAEQLGCSRNAVWHAMKRHDIPRLPAEKRYRESRIFDKSGYVLVRVPKGHPGRTASGYVREHRLLMEQSLGRQLLPTEVVDHIDGNKSNNDLSNLRLFATNSDHLRATLAGRVPEWSEEGKERIRLAVSRPRAKKRKPTPQE